MFAGGGELGRWRVGTGSGNGEGEGSGMEPCGGSEGAGEAWHGDAGQMCALREGVSGECHAYSRASGGEQACRRCFRLPVLSRQGTPGASSRRRG